MIRSALPEDAAAICGIYNHYVLNTVVTFEQEAVSDKEMATRITETLPNLPWLVWEERAEVIGYTYASRWKSRCAYRYSAESTIYVRRDKVGLGIGRKLYERLLSELRTAGMHSVMGGIALPNMSSQRLHEKLGFKKVAHFEEVGRKFEKWIDVGYWEHLFPLDV